MEETKLKLSQNKFTLIDKDLLEYLSQWKWSYDSSTGYAVRRYLGKKVYLHRVILNTPKGYCTDHINHNKLDNRKSNLRIADDHTNAMNSSKQNRITTSRFKGVSWDKINNKWRVNIKLGGKVKNLGRYTSELEAASIYNMAAVKIFGEFANLNNLNEN